jgi:hypothetical protein
MAEEDRILRLSRKKKVLLIANSSTQIPSLYMRVAGFDNPVTFLVLSFMKKTNCEEESLDVTTRTMSQCKLQL